MCQSPFFSLFINVFSSFFFFFSSFCCVLFGSFGCGFKKDEVEGTEELDGTCPWFHRHETYQWFHRHETYPWFHRHETYLWFHRHRGILDNTKVTLVHCGMAIQWAVDMLKVGSIQDSVNVFKLFSGLSQSCFWSVLLNFTYQFSSDIVTYWNY